MWINEVPSPAFVLDRQRLRQNLELIQGVQQKAGVEIILALKAFALWRVFPMIGEYLSGATASSVNEARLIVEEMGRKAHTYAVAYKEESLEQLLPLSSHLTFNSLSQWERFKHQALAYKGQVSFGLRVNPEQSDVETALYNPADPESRLGELQETLKNGLPDGIEGLHFHVLCESSAEALEQVLQAFEQRFGHLLPQVKWVNMGGGHLMTRQDYDLERLIQVLKNFREKHQVEVILEPGSAIAWQTGELITTVLDIHHGRLTNTAIIDASFTAHMPDTLEMPYRPKIRGAAEPRGDKVPYSYRIGGVSCLAGDFMDAYGFPEPLQVGSRLIFEDMIHYTMVKTTMFNGVEHPSICLLEADGSFEVLRRFGYEDYKNRMA